MLQQGMMEFFQLRSFWHIRKPCGIKSEFSSEEFPDQICLSDTPSSVDGHELRVFALKAVAKHFLFFFSPYNIHESPLYQP